jgi:nicotinate phosphoribosyltransferase
MDIPNSIEPYTDVYFLRSLEILKQQKLNPIVRYQVFVRIGPGKIYGINTVIKLIRKFCLNDIGNIRVYGLNDGDDYDSRESVLVIEGPIQSLIALETVLLGIISFHTTRENDHHDINLDLVTERMKLIVQAAGSRPVYYFGARHWIWSEDQMIAKAAISGGAINASTDIGASILDKKGVGTIPHSLEAVFALKYGIGQAVIKSVQAFDEVMDQKIPRVALVDFRNHEIDDAINCFLILGNKLYGVRVDTGGENVMQGGIDFDDPQKPFWGGFGVTVSGVASLKRALINSGGENVAIMLSSGFGQLEKVRAFIQAEKETGFQLFDSLGIGELFAARFATMDIVGAGETFDTIKPIAKTGRSYKPNSRLKKLI